MSDSTGCWSIILKKSIFVVHGCVSLWVNWIKFIFLVCHQNMFIYSQRCLSFDSYPVSSSVSFPRFSYALLTASVLVACFILCMNWERKEWLLQYCRLFIVLQHHWYCPSPGWLVMVEYTLRWGLTSGFWSTFLRAVWAWRR